MSIYPYQTREVRDLAWACFSPPLLATAQLSEAKTGAGNCAFPLTTGRRQWLEALDRDATPLLDHLAGLRDRRLGVYFESLWQFFLSQDEEVEPLAFNLPVQDDARTLGEFDCLYFCRRRNCHVHLELAVKFYLGWQDSDRTDGTSPLSDWLGPDPRDRLDAKVNHLLTHQIQLGATAAAKPHLQALGIDELAREIEMKGYLSSPVSTPMPPPAAFDRRQRLHHWLRVDDLVNPPRLLSAEAYLILPRCRWLSPARASPAGAISTPSDLFESLRGDTTLPARPKLVATLDPAGAELERFFVTGPDWPAR
jgi:hypothetical protein